MANSSSFLGKDRGGREEWNKLLSGLKPFTCACVSPAKSCCYLLPVQSDLRGSRCAVSLGATQVPPTPWTPGQQGQRGRELQKLLSASEWIPKGREGHPWEVWEACVDTIHMDKEREEGEKPPKTKPHNHRTIQSLVKSSNSSHQCNSLLQQVLVLPPQQRQRNLLTCYLPKKKNSIAERLHCKKSQLTPTPDVLILRLKCLTEEPTEEVKCQS